MALTLPGTKKKTDNNPAPARNRVLPKTFSFGPPGTGGDALAELVRRRDAGVLSHTEFLREVELLNRVLRGGSLPPTSFAPEAEFPGGPAQAQQAGMLPKAPVKPTKPTKAVSGFEVEEGVGLMPKVQAKPLGDGGDMPFDLGEVIRRGLLSGDIGRAQALDIFADPLTPHSLFILSRTIRNRFGTQIPSLTRANATQFITVGTPTPESAAAFIDKIMREGQALPGPQAAGEPPTSLEQFEVQRAEQAGVTPSGAVAEPKSVGRFVFDPNTFSITDIQTGQRDQQLSNAFAAFLAPWVKAPIEILTGPGITGPSPVIANRMKAALQDPKVKAVLAAATAPGVTREQALRILLGETPEAREETLSKAGISEEEKKALGEAAQTEEERVAGLLDLYLKSIGRDPATVSQATKAAMQGNIPDEAVWSMLETGAITEEQAMAEFRLHTQAGRAVTEPATPVAKAVWRRLQGELAGPTAKVGVTDVLTWRSALETKATQMPRLTGFDLTDRAQVQVGLDALRRWMGEFAAITGPNMSGADPAAIEASTRVSEYIKVTQELARGLEGDFREIMQDLLAAEREEAKLRDPNINTAIEAQMEIARLTDKRERETALLQQKALLFQLLADPTRHAILMRMPEFREWAAGLGITLAEPAPAKALDRNTLLAEIQQVFGNERELLRRIEVEREGVLQDPRFIELAVRLGLSPQALAQQVASLVRGTLPGAAPTAPPETTTVR